MANFLTLLNTLTQLLPAIVAAIKAIEDAIPGEGAGEAKLAAVRGMLESVYREAGSMVVSFEALWSVVKPAIGVIVSALNAAGWKR